MDKDELENPWSVSCNECKKHLHPEKCWAIWKDGVPIATFCTAACLMHFVARADQRLHEMI